MENTLASKFCESLGMSVILCRDQGTEHCRCLSSHLCGTQTCGEHHRENQETEKQLPAVQG